MNQWVRKPGEKSKSLLVAASLGLAALVGTIDYLTGFELYFFAFYLIPVFIAGWFVGGRFALFLSVVCVALSAGGDLIAGARYSSVFVLVWNGLILVAFYFVVVGILMRLRLLYAEMEERVRQRTAALRNEMAERARLEEEILRVSEREQRRIGHDLHDSLCQHLVATALAGKVLSERMAGSPAQAKAVDHIVNLTEEAIDLTRKLARGLHPMEFTEEGFMDALSELAEIIREQFKIPCRFECDDIPGTLGQKEATQLFRIAQEAATNAARHSKAGEIIICLECSDDFTTLSVSDDGDGMPGNASGRQGMGLRIMAYRADLIRARFDITRLSPRGTRVACAVPRAA